MHPRPLFIILTVLCLAMQPANAQIKHRIYKMEERIMKGDKEALFEIAPFFDNKEQIIEFLGHHVLEPTLSSIAKRIVEENCLFTNTEIVITDSTSWKTFSRFLEANKDKIVFSKLAAAFVITPPEKRTARFDIRKLTALRQEELATRSLELQSFHWIREQKIDSFLVRKDPYAMVLIASELFKGRHRYNRYQDNETDYLDLLSLITGNEVGVEDEKKAISWHIDKDYYPDSKLNLLIYFLNHYKEYSWNEDLGMFINPRQIAILPGKEAQLFELLNHKKDSVAMDAFVQLTTCNPDQVGLLAKEYDNANVSHNYCLPGIGYRFLTQLSILTAWCKAQGIDFQGSPSLRNTIRLLQTDLPFAQKYQLENEVASSLTPDEITAFEYWALINENSWNLTFSAGRILDIFYSKNWHKIVADKKQLDLYLKKSMLFDRLGIVGACNNYLLKFTGSSTPLLNRLKNYQTKDGDIQQQIEMVIALNNAKPLKDSIFIGDSNRDYKVPNLQKELIRLTKEKRTEDNERKIVQLLAKINYQQIPQALQGLEQHTFSKYRNIYSFMEDFGFFEPGNFDSPQVRKDFISRHASYSEYEVYAYYLDRAGFDYKKADRSLDYDKIYEMLKYDFVTPLAGGGNSRANNEVYSLVKLLELTFKTTLGFPHKHCNGEGMYSCTTVERARAWMKYLEAHKLLVSKHDEPGSFSRGYDNPAAR